MSRPTDVNDHATFESRSAGGHARAAKFREVREEAKERAIERLAGMSDKALTRLELILEAEDDGVAYRAVRDVLDRIGTRTVDHAHSGHFEVDVAIAAAASSSARASLRSLRGARFAPSTPRHSEA